MDATQIIITIVGTVAGTLGGKEAWAYYKRRLDIKAQQKDTEAAGETELREEIQDMLEGQIDDLKKQVKSLLGRIKQLELEREGDKKRIANQEIKIALLSERLGKYTRRDDDIPEIE